MENTTLRQKAAALSHMIEYMAYDNIGPEEIPVANKLFNRYSACSKILSQYDPGKYNAEYKRLHNLMCSKIWKI